MSRAILDMQTLEGHSAGSWKPEGTFSKEGGRLYMTSLATCILEVYYRHMPLNTNEILHVLEDKPNDGSGGTMLINGQSRPVGSQPSTTQPRPTVTPRPPVTPRPAEGAKDPNRPPGSPEGNLGDLMM